MQRMVRTVGTLNGFEDVTITPKVEGRVRKVYHEAGDRVRPGELLLEIDSTDFALAVDEARRGLELELARLGVDAIPADSFDVKELPVVERAQLLLENASRQRARTERLREQNVATQEEWEQTQTDYEVAEANLRQANLEARATLATARHRQAVLAMAEQRLADTRIAAPAFPSLGSEHADDADYVIAERLVSEGEMVRAFPSTAVMQLVMDQPLKLTGPAAERYMGEVHVGQTAKLLVEAYPGEIFEAKISRVNPTVDPVNRTFRFEAIVDNRAHRLKAGGFAKVGIFTRVDEQAMTVPVQALVTYAGVTKVFENRGGKAYAVEVRTGERGRGWVEVSGPLEPSAMIITSGQSQLAEGTPVKIRQPAAPRVAERAP